MTELSTRVISIYNRRTSIRFTPSEWNALNDICQKEHIQRKTLIELIDLNRDEKIGLASSIRLFIIIYLLNDYMPKETNGTFNSPIFEAIKEII